MTGTADNLERYPAHKKRAGLKEAKSRRIDPGKRIVAISGPGPLPAIIINAVADRFGPITVIQEDKESSFVLIRRRMRLVGFLPTLGQVAFGILLKFIQRVSKRRINEIVQDSDLNPVLDTSCEFVKVQSVNDIECQAVLRKLSPCVVLVVGTRMIRKPTLESVDVPFINYHAGINPLYRGMNGGYWALLGKNTDNAGVSIHLVDEGVDTGDVLYAAVFDAKSGDNFVTYPFLQAAIGRSLVIKALEDALADRIKAIKVDLPSKQWFHPTIWQYLKGGLTSGVW